MLSFNKTSAAIALCALALVPVTAVAERKPAVAVVADIDDPAEFAAALFSPNGRILAVADGAFTVKKMTLWDLGSGRPLRHLVYPAFFTAMAFAPDGKSIATGHKDGAVKLWDIETGAATTIVPGKDDEESAVSSLWIDDKGEVLVFGDVAGAATVWDLGQRKLIDKFVLAPVDTLGNRARIVAARRSADASRVIALAHAAGGLDSVNVWDARPGATLAATKLPKTYAFADGGMLDDDAFLVRVPRAGCKTDRLVQFNLSRPADVVDAFTPSQCDKPEYEGDTVAPNIFAAAGGARALIKADGDPAVTLWDARARRVERTLAWPDDAAKGLIGADRGLTRAATVATDGLRIRDAETGAPVKELPAYGYPAENAVAAKDGRVIALPHALPGGDEKLKDLTLWKLDGLAPKTTRLTASGVMTIYDVSVAASLALGGNDKGELYLLSTETGREQAKFALPNFKTVEKASLAPDGKTMIVLGEDARSEGDSTRHIAVLARTGDGGIIRTFKQDGGEANDEVFGATFSPDGKRFAFARRGGTAEIWSTQEATRIRLLPAATRDATDTWALAFSPDGRFLIGGSLFDETVFVWNTATGKVVRKLDLGAGRAHYRHAGALALSHDGKTLAAGLAQRAVSSGDIGPERGGIVVWDAA
ncbi:MAG TPA: WD40 repeat domain-containing protein, partial [Xanthobacteraceae bacterium]|nr:WD40 repeat domain-containing protein [Xanthobacteraceae bacterium]